MMANNLWEDFQYYDGEPFLAAPHNLSLSLSNICYPHCKTGFVHLTKFVMLT